MIDKFKTYSKERLLTELFSITEEFKALKTQILQEMDLLDLLEKHYNNINYLIEEKEKGVSDEFKK